MAASWLANPRETRAVLERHGLHLKRRLGQNFLVDDNVIRRILELAELKDTDVVLEVGPGIGTLTVALLPRVRRLVAIEADRTLPAVLAETCARDGERLRLIEGDALRVTPQEVLEAAGEDPTKLVSNLPYQVAATIVLGTLVDHPSVSRLVVMVQSEVADRISAIPGTKAYGAYSAKLALLGSVTGRFEVPPTCFMPAPHVDSAVVRIDRTPLCEPAFYPFAARVIDGAFCQRRKTIRNTLGAAGFERAATDAALSALGIDPRVRAETLGVEALLALARELEVRDA